MKGEQDTIDNKSTGKLDLIAVKSFPAWDEMYRIVDFLNKSLKEHHLMFGLKNGEHETMIISIYEV